MAQQQTVASDAGKVGSVRWGIMAVTFIVASVAYLDRNNISIAASFVQKDFGLSNLELGWVFSAFVTGYAFSQPLAGYIADRAGPHKSIILAITWWSIFTAAVPLVPAGFGWSLTLLLFIRFLLGVGEAIIYPAANRLVANWIPSRERGFANGLIFASVGVGGGMAPPLITYLMTTQSWQWAFYVSAMMGIVVGVIWLIVIRDRPQDHKSVGAAERAYIEDGLTGPKVVTAIRWRDIFGDRQVLTLAASYFTFGYVAYIFFTWFFKYLSDVRGLNLKASALYATLPFVAMAVASSVGGYIADGVSKRYGKRMGRCGVAGASLFTCSLLIWAGTQAEEAQVAALILAAGAGALYIAQSAFWTISADMGGASAGRLSGVMNMGAQIGGIVTASLTPYIADSFGWTASFATAAALSMVGAILWIFVDPSHTLKGKTS